MQSLWGKVNLLQRLNESFTPNGLRNHAVVELVQHPVDISLTLNCFTVELVRQDIVRRATRHRLLAVNAQSQMDEFLGNCGRDMSHLPEIQAMQRIINENLELAAQFDMAVSQIDRAYEAQTMP